MTKRQQDILDYLRRAIRRDIEKGEHKIMTSGLRDTRQVADYLGVSLAIARRHLAELVDLGLLDCYEPCSRALMWRLTIANDDGGKTLIVPRVEAVSSAA